MIRGREAAKFVFTRVLSDLLADLSLHGERLGLTAETLSFTTVDDLTGPDGTATRDAGTLSRAAERGRAEWEASRAVCLPPLVSGPGDVWSFATGAAQPNYVTDGRVVGPVALIDDGDPPDGAIAFVASADPGYDWMFARGVAGLVTAFGGVNSHMAIRAQELGLPAVIGVGEEVFRLWSRARMVEIDAMSGMVTPLP
ncbi:PEP-utilizing enzyme [Streptomyces sp. G45]|uniref:PEP-utilizing enzyme n=1 Tax=Streptomyces sp. G45 TaxID=3406627 RepID=UPI003C1B6FDA